MTATEPPLRSSTKRQKGKNKEIYANPLPIFSTPDAKVSWLSSHPFAAFKSTSSILSNPGCIGVLDVASKSVWVVNSRDTQILWQRGFFGKGSLSRSEPSWLTRQLANANGQASGLTAEQVTSKRRADRKQFKAERAEAIAAARKEAETVFAATGVLPPISELGFIPSVNRPMKAPSHSDAPKAPTSSRPDPAIENLPKGSTPILELDSEIEQMEHLQLTLPEAFFLSWALGCLRILDPNTNIFLTPEALFSSCLDVHLPMSIPEMTRRPDNPFLVNYVVYHYYRSLGWVVKGGIKFCVDYMLYKRGPVFNHAEFAVVICPVYEDPTDEESSPFELPNAKPLDWAWFSTINRVNSQVMKTLVLCYVTIPSRARLSSDDSSGPSANWIANYSVREVVVRRFIPARMRD